MLRLSQLVRVRKLDPASTVAGKHFLKCTCSGRQKEGVPCPCLFRISENAGVNCGRIIDLGMVDARYLKLFNSHYGDPGPIGDMLCKAQKEYFEYENMKTLVSKTTMTMLSGESDAWYLVFGPNTTYNDFDEVHFIMSTDTCTTLDLER